jgi:hypothetical protein
MSIIKARTNSKPSDTEKGELYIIVTWNKKRSKSKHIAFYAKDFFIPTFSTTFDPINDWECEAFALKDKKVTSHYFSHNEWAKTYLASKFSKHPTNQSTIEKCYDGLFLKVE